MRLIDADALDIDNLNRAYDDNFELDFGRLYTADVIDMIANAPTINAIPIPEDATNGDVIKAVFSNVKIIVSETGEIAHIHENALIKDNFMFVQVSTKWLDTPYKAESEAAE